MITYEWLYVLAGGFFVVWALLSLKDGRLGNAAFWALLGLSFLIGSHVSDLVNGVLQGGAGTSTNMCANEIIANRCLELMGHEKGDYENFHPIDHVNRSQSTNDTYPTSIKLAMVFGIQRLLKERPRALGLAVPGMPIGSPGMDGPATLQEIRKHWGALPVILHTGHVDGPLELRHHELDTRGEALRVILPGLLAGLARLAGRPSGGTGLDRRRRRLRTHPRPGPGRNRLDHRLSRAVL